MNQNKKEFKTYEQQIDILINERGMTITNKENVKKILKQENYYSVVNGYKDLFLDSTQTTEKYLPGTNFNEIYALYKFDRELRNILIKKILIVENNIKSIIAYEFSKAYGNNDYLKLDNFENTSNENVSKIIKLFADVHGDISRQIGKDNSLTHYLENHGYIPLWVLTKIMTFGRISKLFPLMKQSEKTQVAIAISKNYQISFTDLGKFLEFIAIFRNLCAHEERTYNFRKLKQNKVPINIVETNIHKKLAIQGKRNGLFDLIICLKLLLEEELFENLFVKIEQQINILSSELKVISIDKVLASMNFPNNWKEISKH